MVVQHNLTAMNSNRMLGLTSASQAKSTEKLSSGYKINRAADDAAGLSISEKMRKQIRGLTQASSNAQDGISAVQTAEGALNEVQDMLQRMNELAVKAANGTQSVNDRSYIQNEIDQLVTEIDRVSETTKFNETYLLKGDQDAAKVATYNYKNYTSGEAAKVKDAAGNLKITDATTNLSVQFTFTDNANQDLQNELAKSIKSQGVNVEFNSTWAKGGKVTDTFTFNLNGAAAENYKVVVADATGKKFEIQDLEGNKIAEVDVAAKTGSSVAQEGDPDKTLKATITAAQATAAKTQGEQAAYYDRDGNKISANALSNYFTFAKSGGAAEAVTARVDAPDVYDALGNKVKLDKDLIAGQKDLVGALNLTLHVGADATSNNQISVNLDAMSAKGLGVNGLKVDGGDDSNALAAIQTISEAIQKVSTQRSALGAVQNRLEHTINNLDNVVENTTSAESAIRDTDMATEMVKYSNNNILSQAGQAMLAQANQSNQGVLSLLG